MTQTFWLSFCDSSLPKGTQFLGAAVVDVTEDDVKKAMPTLLRIRAEHSLPPPEPGDDACWIAGAVDKAHRTFCNPGGQVLSVRMDDHPNFPTLGRCWPRQRLMTKEDIEAIDDAIEQATP